MRNFFIQLIISAIAAYGVAYFLPGVELKGWVATVLLVLTLGFLNSIVKPILVFLTIPVSILTLGLFLLVINAGMVLIADWFLIQFSVNGWITALLFSCFYSLANSFLDKLFGPSDKK